MKKFKSISILILVVFSTLANAQQQRMKELTKEKESLIAENKILRDSISRLTAYDTSQVYFTVALEKSKKTVYRGMQNKLTIVVPKAVWIEAEAPGLRKVDDFGHYALIPGKGLTTEIKIRAGMPDGCVYEDSKVFNIKGVPSASASFNGRDGRQGVLKLSVAEIINGEVSLEMFDFDYDFKMTVKKFKVRFQGGDEIEVDGNKLDERANQLINKIKNKNQITIYDILSDTPGNILMCKINPIVIEIDKKTASKK